MATLPDLLERIRTYAPDADFKPVQIAYLLAARAHAGQRRKSGEDYLTHPLAVAMICAEMGMDVDTIATALLHDALEDNPITKGEMTAQVGSTITSLVDGVTKIGKLRFRSQEELAAENFRKMILAMSVDLRVILVKLADRLHNMRTLEGHGAADKEKAIAAETLDIYVPLASRLGLDRVKCELEDLCFRTLQPERYAEIAAFLESSQADRDRYTARVIESLERHLRGQHVECVVKGRAKHPWSIHRKSVKQGVELGDIADILAFRLIVKDVGACYAALGLIHATYTPIPNRIKDYIARPKHNGYRALHTTIIGPEGRRVEVQIRTQDMDDINEKGIAAHWTYKEGHLALSPEEMVEISRIRDLLEAARDAEDATEFMETVKVEFFTDEVFVFTPRGDVKRFRMGATALDFAFSVHTDVGMRCTGARVNGRMVPLKYELCSGDHVEVLTSPNQRPNRDWLKHAKTGRAIQKIRRFLRQEEREQAVRLGREMIEAELKRFDTSLAKVKANGALKAVLKTRNHRELEPLLVDVAHGHATLSEVVREMLPEGVYLSRQEAAHQSSLQALIHRFLPREESPVLIDGEHDVLVTYAKCCGPLPGEQVVGFITRGRGITVHRAGCPQLTGMDPERRIPVGWLGGVDTRHSGSLRIYCSDKLGMLAAISQVCAQAKVNIQRADARGTESDESAVVSLEVTVRDVAELTRLIRNIEQLEGVDSVHRTAG